MLTIEDCRSFRTLIHVVDGKPAMRDGSADIQNIHKAAFNQLVKSGEIIEIEPLRYNHRKFKWSDHA